MIDLSSKSKTSDALTSHLDAAIIKKVNSEPPRDYLGGSQIGWECERQLQFDFFNTTKDPGKEFNGQTLRIFARGHWVESVMIEWMRLAGIEVLTHDKKGDQFGFNDNGFSGHCDGIIVNGPKDFGPFPRLWENKGLKESAWKDLKTNKLKKSKPEYYAQCQIYMRKFELMQNPALFSAVNMNTMEIYWESISYVSSYADMLDMKAQRVLNACRAGDLLPRAWTDNNFYKCKWCAWQKRCLKLSKEIYYGSER